MKDPTDDISFRTLLIVQEISTLTGESKAEVVHRSVDERLRRLTGPANRTERKQQILNTLESSLWAHLRADQLGRKVSNDEQDEILGYGPEGV